MNELARLSIDEASRLIARHDLACVDYVAAHRDISSEKNGTLSAFVTQDWEAALEQAEVADAVISRRPPRSRLHGIPIGIKDVIDVARFPTTCHSRQRLDHLAASDAHVVARLRRAGAIFPGKMATHEFAIGGPAFDAPFPPARNPWNPACHPGGSSSGPGAGVASGMVPGAIGTDTGGSIRHPASHCGIVGLKPTSGLVSRGGVFPLSFTLDHVGPMTRTVRDCAIVMNEIAGFDWHDPGSRRVRKVDYERQIDGDIDDLTFGFVRHFHERDIPADDRITRALDQGVEVFRSAGRDVREIELPRLQEFATANRVICAVEAASIHGTWMRESPELYASITVKRLLPGFFLSGEHYVRALQIRNRLAAQVDEAFKVCDILVTASSMDLACAIEDTDEIERTFARRHARYPFNLTGHPAIVVPCGLCQPENLPIALQLVGRRFEEAMLLRAAATFERLSGWGGMTPVT